VIHVDVMDGHFVPPITMGPLVVSALKEQVHEAGGILDVHLMIERPSTPIEAYTELMKDIEIALCMTVNPGWGGQPFIESTTEKVERLRTRLDPRLAIGVDGGIDATTGPRTAVAGARLFVAGSSVFGDPEPGEAYTKLARAVDAV
jgi:ribulose-phosphate 3-epimerase